MDEIRLHIFVIMRFRKVIISLFLFLTYSIGFAHNLVPHCTVDFENSNIATKDSHHHHNHHEHNGEDEADHDHIVHEDHLDSGYLDLVICLLEDVEHGDEECGQEHCFTLSSNNLSLKNFSKIQMIYVVFGLLQESFIHDQREYFNIEYSHIILSPPLEKSPHRGPPVFTC